MPRLVRPKVERSADLLAKIGRGIEQRPGCAVAGYRKARLRTWPDARIATPRQRTDRAAAVPLRVSAARGGAEDDGLGRRTASGCACDYRSSSSWAET